MPAKVLLCDSQLLTRIGLRTILTESDEVDLVGECGDGRQALAAVSRMKPEVVLADLALPDLDVVDLVRRVRADGPAPGGRRPAILLMVSEMDDRVLAALRAGASGVLLRDCRADEVVRAVRVIVEGGGFLAPQIVRHVLDRLAGHVRSGAGAAAADMLTKREQEVLSLVAEGLSNVEIGHRLYVGEPTVKYHMSQLLRKLDLRDRLQAAAFAHRNGLVTW